MEKKTMAAFHGGRGAHGNQTEGYQGGLVYKAHSLVYHSTLGCRVIKKKKTGYTGIFGF